MKLGAFRDVLPEKLSHQLVHYLPSQTIVTGAAARAATPATLLGSGLAEPFAPKHPDRIAAFQFAMKLGIRGGGPGLLIQSAQQQFLRKQGYGLLLVAMLGAVPPSYGGQAGLLMDGSNGTVGRVLVLPAGAAGSKGLEAHVIRGDNGVGLVIRCNGKTPTNQFRLRWCGRSGLWQIH